MADCKISATIKVAPKIAGKLLIASKISGAIKVAPRISAKIKGGFPPFNITLQEQEEVRRVLLWADSGIDEGSVDWFSPDGSTAALFLPRCNISHPRLRDYGVLNGRWSGTYSQNAGPGSSQTVRIKLLVDEVLTDTIDFGPIVGATGTGFIDITMEMIQLGSRIPSHLQWTNWKCRVRPSPTPTDPVQVFEQARKTVIAFTQNRTIDFTLEKTSAISPNSFSVRSTFGHIFPIRSDS